jgi:hypothetical protein
MSTKRVADAWSLGSGSGGDEVEEERVRGNAPTTIRSRSSWRTFPGAVSVAPMRETPERMGGFWKRGEEGLFDIQSVLEKHDARVSGCDGRSDQ